MTASRTIAPAQRQPAEETDLLFDPANATTVPEDGFRWQEPGAAIALSQRIWGDEYEGKAAS